MSASGVFVRFGASIFRRRLHRGSLHIASSLRPIIFANPIVRFHRHCSSASAAECVLTSTVDSCENQASVGRHPWPEWVSFVDCLNAKGYLAKSSGTSSPGVAGREENGDESVYKDMHALKSACLSFGRERFDMLKMLPTRDIQAVVEKGCPNLFRKAVYSGKRLREYLQLKEEHACGACNLRGSCDRANVILKESDGVARTVDIVRLLFLYAMDPLVTSGGEKPPGRELIESSVRKLLLELIELSETPIDPELTKPTPATFSERKRSAGSIVDDDWESYEVGRRKSTGNMVGKDKVEMKSGDWICSKCNFMNFAKNMKCRECDAVAPKRFSGDDIEMRKGDWKCIKCDFINFASRSSCKMCTQPQPKQNLEEWQTPKRLPGNDHEMREGDWKCMKCDFINFAGRSSCKMCTQPHPKQKLNREDWESPKRSLGNDHEMREGDWKCLKCEFINFASRSSCKRCSEAQPKQRLNSGEREVPRRLTCNDTDMKEGDWKCIKCEFVNFARRSSCKRCSEPQPKQLLNPGEWECPS
ncbi:unnamed protein product [Cuscuta campestris]|uniref:RanBP2-type domain-containing protein n=1 Tax=Cuscuta campestris TaxID=132261 RepID=A0A484MEP9_9ASTE|nr:unnamed protein product [Cuscuta campestris]